MTDQQYLALLAVRAQKLSRSTRGVAPWAASANPDGFRDMLLRGRPDSWIVPQLEACRREGTYLSPSRL